MITYLQILFLLGLANGTPILARNLLGRRLRAPLDGHVRLADGHRLLGSSKTVTGAVSAVLVTGLAAILIGLPWTVGVLTGALAMVGDALSSFVKRRLGLKASSRAPGLDQVPESLLPLMVLRTELGIGWWDVTGLVIAFVVLEVLLSPLLYRWNIRNRPY